MLRECWIPLRAELQAFTSEAKLTAWSWSYAGWFVSARTKEKMKHWNPFHLCLSLFLSVLLRNTPKHPNKVLCRTRKDFFSHGLTSALWKLDTSVRISSDSDWCRWTVVTALLFDTHALANCIQKCNYFCSYLSPQYYYPCPPTHLSQGMTRFIS